MSLATQTLPEASVTEIAAGAAFQATGLPDIPVFLGPATRGPFTPTAFSPGDVAGLVSTYGNGPAVKNCAYAISKVASPFVFLRMITASVSGTLSSVTVVRTASGTAPTNTIAGTPTDGADVVIKYGTVGGTTGTGPIAYQISLDGGATYGSVQALGTGTSITVLGVTLTLGSGKTITANDTTAWFQTVASSTVLPLNVAGVAGTSVASVSGTPLDWYEVAFEVVDDGNAGGGTVVGTAGIKYKYTLDYLAPTPTWTPVTALGTATSLLLLDGPVSTESTGLTLAFTHGSGQTLVTGDIIIFNTTGPTYDSAGLTSATTALTAWNGQWTWFHASGEVTESIAATADSIVSGWDATAQPSWGIVEARDRATTETLAAWSARVDIDYGPYTSTRVGVNKGKARIACPINGRNNRRSGVTPCLARAMGAGGTTIATDWAQFDLGPLTADVSLINSALVTVEYDGFKDPNGVQMGFLALRSWPGSAGVYPARMALLGPTTDIQAIPLRRVMNVAKKLEKQVLQLQVVKAFRQWKAGATPSPYVVGDIYEPDARKIDRLMRITLKQGVFNQGWVSDITWVLNRTPISLGGGSWQIKGKMQITALIYVVKADGTAQFVSATVAD
jgi:hypothetical protein